MRIKSALLKLTKAARDAHYMDSAMETAGYSSNPYADIYGNIADAVYELLGEHTDTFDESVTCATLLSFAITNEQCAEYLFSAFKLGLDE